MSNYQKLCENLKDLKLTQINLKLDEYITRVNEGNISIVDALYELTSKEIEVKTLTLLMQW